jgi:hemerythrin superfamily protein
VRSIAEQSVEELGGSGSLLARQRRDHTRLDDLLDQVQHGGDQDETLTSLWRLVFPHAYAEETVVWPSCARWRTANP